MRPKIDLKYGIGKNPIFGQIDFKNGKKVLTGAPIVEQYGQFITDWNINITFEENFSNVGEYINGSYTDLFRLLQRKQIDAILHLHPYTVHDDAFQFTALNLEYQFAIHSFTKPIERESVDVINSLNILDSESWTFLFVVALIYFITLKILKYRVRLIDLLGEFFQQYCRRFSAYSMKLYSFLLVSVFWVFLTAISAYFSTELTIDILPPRIETLSDIVTVNITAIFTKVFEVAHFFKDPLSPVHRKVWRIVQKNLVDYNNYDYSGAIESLFSAMADAISGKVVGILPLSFKPLLTCAFCAYAGNDMKTFLDKKKIYFVSKPFMNTVNSHPIRNGLEISVFQRLNDIGYSFSESGIIEFIMSNLKQTAWRTIGNFENCVNMVHQESIHFSEILYEAIELGNFTQTTFSLLLLLTVASFVCIIEYLTIPKTSESFPCLEVISREVSLLEKPINSEKCSVIEHSKITDTGVKFQLLPGEIMN